jgi:glycosyltransferase involved in cell wall biosynthesis
MKNMNLMTPINSLGYGVAGVNILKSLRKEDVKVACFPIGNPEVTLVQDRQEVQEALNIRETFDSNAPCLKIWHEFAMAERIGSGPLFGFPFFEITKFDDRRIHNLNSTNGVIVASKWAAGVVTDNIKASIPVHVCPLGVDRKLFHEKRTTHTFACPNCTSLILHGSDAIDDKRDDKRGICPKCRNTVTTPPPDEASSSPMEKCEFLNCGKWETRKGHDILLRAFTAAFPTEQDVALSMLPTNPFLNSKEKSEWEVYYRSDPRVKIIDRVGSQLEVANIMMQSTCGVFPSRAEGWNLELLEMMSCGKPVIATNYSAHTEFCNEKNALLIEIDSMETASDGKWFDGHVGEWASLEGNAFDALVSHMRDVYVKWQSASPLVNEEGIRTAVDFSWKRTAENIKKAIYEN